MTFIINKAIENLQNRLKEYDEQTDTYKELQNTIEMLRDNLELFEQKYVREI